MSIATLAELVERYKPLLEDHDIAHDAWENLVLFVTDRLESDHPFVQEMERNEQHQRFVEAVLAQELEPLRKTVQTFCGPRELA